MPDLPLILLFSAIGFLLGALVAVLVNRSPVNRQDVRLLEMLRERAAHYQQLISFWQERNSQKLAVWSGDKMLEDAQVLTRVQRQELVRSTRSLLVWLGESTAPLVISQPPAETAAQKSDIAKDVHAPSTGEPDLPGAGGEEKKEGPLSIVDQMNEILKNQVAGTPLEGRGIRLVADPQKGVVVWVGLSQFVGVDAVADPQVKAALRAAAMEWENRQERPRRP